ncbi:protein kinase [Micromonospora sp. NPDC047527]|uniref:protein kinase domain-containing protein n=1 Tax=Micromonospora sp. NPDC047527 TaxID=3155144 RepID=UPI003411AF88
MPDAPRQLIANRYRLVRPLGQGGMGRVWQARDEMLQRDVAIKELVAPPGLRDDERREMRERSMREARAVARLGHVNVVRVFDVLHSGDDPWIVMELVPSRSLHEVLEAEGPMSAASAARIGLGVLSALRAAHRAGVLHRDVKPANVLLADDGRVVLTDFGLATLPGDPRMTQTGMVLGSPAYLAPERATDGDVGPAADLWSLGATLYAAVEGRTPYQRSSPMATLAALATEAPPPAQRAGQLTPLLEGLLRRDPDQRISAEEADRLLRHAAGPVDPVSGGGQTGPLGGIGPSSSTAAASAPAVPVARINTGEGTPQPIVPEFVTARSGRPVESPPTVPAASATSPAPAATTESSLASVVPTESSPVPAVTAESSPVPAVTADPAPVVSTTWNAPLPTPSVLGSVVPPDSGVVPTSGPARRRRGWLVGSIAAAVLVVVLVSASLLNGGSPGTPGPAAPTADPSSVAEAPVAGVLPPPSGWRYHRDDPRFLVPVPDGWRSQRVGEGVEFREPGGSRRLVLDELRSVPADLVAGLRTREKAERERYASYRRVRLAALKYQVRAAEWEWTYTDADGTPMRASSRAFVDRNGHAYTIGWTTSDAEWSVSRGIFELVTDGFQGLPVTAAPPSGSASSPPAGGAGHPSTGPGGGSTTAAGKPGQQPSTPAAPPPSPTQASAPAGQQIVSFASDRCIDIRDGNATAGARLQIWDCRRTAKQLWTFPADGTVRSMGKCLDVAGHSTADGAAVQLADCTGAASQKFNLNKAHDLVNVRADRCVDVLDGNPDNGARLQIWQCTGNANQKWRAA